MGIKAAHWLGIVTLAIMTAAIFMVFVYAPTEAQQETSNASFIFMCLAHGSHSPPLHWSQFQECSISGSAIRYGMILAAPPPKWGCCSAEL
jgi:hypothetical protein